MTLRLQVNGQKKYRQAKLSLIHQPITIPAAKHKTVNKDGGHLPLISGWAIMVIERHPPANTTPIKWVLLTNLPITNCQEAIEKVRWYAHRWNIEIFHKIIKSGCSVEKAQLRTAERLKKYIVLKSIIAWRLFWLCRTFKVSQEDSCELVLSEMEWKILYQKIHHQPPPTTPPRIKEIYHWIARLGGYIDRKSDPPPGIVSIWRGWTRFTEVIEDYHAFCGHAL